MPSRLLQLLLIAGALACRLPAAKSSRTDGSNSGSVSTAPIQGVNGANAGALPRPTSTVSAAPVSPVTVIVNGSPINQAILVVTPAVPGSTLPPFPTTASFPTTVGTPARFIPDYANSPEFFTQMNQSIHTNSPHGVVRIWYSRNLAEFMNLQTFKVPPGSVALLKFDNQDGSGVAVMVKMQAGYDSDHNDWYYEMRDHLGNLAPQPPPGKVVMCYACHAAASPKDYLAGTLIKN